MLPVEGESLDSTRVQKHRMERQHLAEEEGLPDFLFNLANSDRLGLLLEVAVKKQKMSNLSKAIGASTPECSRHRIDSFAGRKMTRVRTPPSALGVELRCISSSLVWDNRFGLVPTTE